MRQDEKIVTVLCFDCNERLDEKLVKFINIEEDMQGCDVLTFECPKCKKVQNSKRWS